MDKIAKILDDEYAALLRRAKKLEKRWVRRTDGAGERVGRITEIILSASHNFQGVEAVVQWNGLPDLETIALKKLREW